jgi:hypothetical protein
MGVLTVPLSTGPAGGMTILPPHFLQVVAPPRFGTLSSLTWKVALQVGQTICMTFSLHFSVMSAGQSTSFIATKVQNPVLILRNGVSVLNP